MVDVNLIPKEYKTRRDKVLTVFSKTLGGALFLLVLSLLLYGGLLFYKGKLNRNLDSIKEEIELLDKKRNLETEKAIVDLDKNLSVVKELFKNHFYWSKVFSKIEELTLPYIYFSKTNLNFLEDKEKINANLSGNALTYTMLARQMVSFQEESSIEKVEVSDVFLNKEGGINFSLGIVFSKDILLKK